ncbi:unnamed protein product, partial [Acanthoscelides obtectus]
YLLVDCWQDQQEEFDSALTTNYRHAIADRKWLHVLCEKDMANSDEQAMLKLQSINSSFMDSSTNAEEKSSAAAAAASLPPTPTVGEAAAPKEPAPVASAFRGGIRSTAIENGFDAPPHKAISSPRRKKRSSW